MFGGLHYGFVHPKRTTSLAQERWVPSANPKHQPQKMAK